MNCSICLASIQKNDIQKKLSCGHVIHFDCYLKIVYHNNKLYIDCPVSREINIDVKKPFNNSEENIRILCQKNKRCCFRTKKGTICKRKAKLFNYGYCHQHNKDILSKEFYPLMEKYIYLILCQQNRFYNKLHLIDLGKKIMMKYCNKDSSVDEILEKYYRFFKVNDIYKISNYGKIYDYYGLEKPEDRWFEYCVNNHCLI